MNIAQVEASVKKLVKNIKKESFVYDFLLAFGTPKSTITMLKNGSRNLSKKEGEIICKKKILFYSQEKIDVESVFNEIISDGSSFRHDPRFVVVTDSKKIFAFDTKLKAQVDFKVKDLGTKFDFFLPLAGIEKKEFQHENPVDVKAAEKLAKLFDLIKLNNPKSDEKSLHSLNVFLTRLLFCYFAEDTDIFPHGLFTNSVGSHTQPDGSDLSDYLKRLFEVMNQEKRPKKMADYVSAFPYVNGGLFAEEHPVPKFCKKSRSALIEVGDLDWAEINPDIFGSMIQAVVHPDQRAGLGMHYTSVPNIMKVIEPLFLDELYSELKKNKNNEKKLRKLLKRLSEIKIFDPACGSGNFLIIAYKELRKLEMLIYKQLPNEFKFSYIPLKNFYGIEIDDFAHEVAILSLWLTEHQMDILFMEEFGEAKASLPLKEGGNICCANSVEADWNLICPQDGSEVYLLGNPPYLGGKMQSTDQKQDMKKAFTGYKNFKQLDYICCWFVKAADYINENSSFAFVTTSSICQGAQVDQLWPILFEKGLEISFAYKPFAWTNNAKGKAAVTCAIVGLRKKSNKDRLLFDKERVHKVKNINPYLVSSHNCIVEKSLESISKLPSILTGNSPYDGGHLILSQDEASFLISKYPEIKKSIKKLWGSSEFIRGKSRYCLWIEDSDLESIKKIPEVSKRISSVLKFREGGGDVARSLVSRPHQFRYRHIPKKSQIIIPRVSSERRDYIPIGYLGVDSIVSDSAQVVLDPEPYVLGLLMSRMHMQWVRITSGRLKTDIRYSSAHSYNTFPIPDLKDKQKESLGNCVLEMLSIREKHMGKTLSDLYDPDTMPSDLKDIHKKLDQMVDLFYSDKLIKSDEKRLELLFKNYQEKVSNKK